MKTKVLAVAFVVLMIAAIALNSVHAENDDEGAPVTYSGTSYTAVAVTSTP